MAETPLAFEIITFVVLALFFIVDLFVIGRRPHVPSTKECVQHIAFFVVMALIFGGCIWFFAGSKPAIEFYSGWLTEYSLSIDNLFVFVIIMSNFAVPKQIQKYVLSIGITIALIFRGIFILIGAALISRFTWVFFLFGAFLIYTAVKLVLGGDEDEEYHENGIIRNLRKIIKITDDYDGEKLRTTKNGVRYWTPMLIVFLTIGTTDVMFAFDSRDLRPDQGSVPGVHLQRVRTARPAAAVLPAGCSARQARLPACRPVRGAGLHRRQAHHGGPARQYLAVHQRRRRRPLGAGGAHMAVAGCDCARNWRRIRGFRDQDEEHGKR